MYPHKGDIYLVNFDPTVGSEIQKTRPALIIQNDLANRYSPIVIVAGITSKFQDPLYPTEVLIKASSRGLKNDSVVLLNQIRSTDKQRLIRKIGDIYTEERQQIDRAIQISLGLV
ncbi:MULTISPECIES: type II toxin-antitoxin system PemK/MazF family toxin [Microcystis]|uniref:type II toxin-antitoxin system PemK/MazF family toxin n=1 Tax=Microcystis sp. M169S2 TaxID=2771157 RepID=UPI000CE9CA12|nr:type II toxin-antitoxin system PemK/MazF family toxin [Microcystis aeruginosa]MCA2716685.1 type II toxin-antitoxin system PemK/MazF family toxin [Microcystis sp. M169S2]WNF16927.1 type II toxin-antitoxin system PemK/MazF family toxin [Microcystis aeruginosa NRERC-214]